jgi:hypothetical protein
VAERLVNFEKGKSYPVRLLDLLGVLPSITTAKYTAQLLPAELPEALAERLPVQ